MHFGIAHSTLIDPRLEKKPGNISKDVTALMKELKTRGIRKLGLEGNCNFGLGAPNNIDAFFAARDSGNPHVRYFKALHLRAKRNGIAFVALEKSGVASLFYSLYWIHREALRALEHNEQLPSEMQAVYRSLSPSTKQQYKLIFTYHDALEDLLRAINVKRTLLIREQAKREGLKDWGWGGGHALVTEKLFGERGVRVNPIPEKEERVLKEANAALEAYRTWKPILDSWEKHFYSRQTIFSKLKAAFQRRKK